ncbi:MAG: hypothetical protein U0797_23120 [Gemmataceae bacterium]
MTHVPHHVLTTGRAMPITFSCSSCKAKMTVPDTLAGKRGKCSKCKGPVIVPGGQVNGAATNGEPAAVLDVEAEAAALLADAPKEEKKADFIEFNCPQCDEPIKMGLDLAGKRAPCPECRRIIAVPIPKDKSKVDWRNAGPKLPAAAKRDDGPAPEGAWGTGAIARASHEALQEAGVIKEKEKPLTFYQRYQRAMLVGGPLVLLAAGGLFAWNWMTRNVEKNAFQAAMSTAAAQNAPALLGGGGLAALHGFAGEYKLGTNKPDCAREAKEQYARAAGLGKSTHAADTDALLADLAVGAQALAGGPEETDTGRKLPWKEAHQLFLATFRGIDSRDGKLAALRRLTTALVERGQTEHVLPMVNGLFGTTGPERTEAVATVGVELYRLGKKEEAGKALAEALAPYFPDKKDKKAKSPELTAPVACLATLEGKEAPPPGKSLVEEEARAVGLAEALARQGKIDDARAKVKGLPRQDGGELRGLIAVAAGADPKAAADEVEKALAVLGNVGKRRDLDWPLLRLIEVGVAAGVSADKLEPAAAAIDDPGLSAWGRLQLLRARLAKSNAVEGVEFVEKIDPKTVGGLVARLELARHNTRLNHGWADTVKSWDEGPRAMGSLGVALGIQGGK